MSNAFPTFSTLSTLRGFKLWERLNTPIGKTAGFFIGFLNEYPDYQTQGMSKEELMENLKDLLVDLESGQVPYIRKVEELSVA